MNENYKLEFELIQQTPMLHFQHGQQGATLRASEVKPKLDRFLLKKLGGFDKVWEEHCDWFIGNPAKNDEKARKSVKEKPALDYKLRILANAQPEKSETIEFDIAVNNAMKTGLKASEAKRAVRSLHNYTGINSMYFGNMVTNNGDYEENVRDNYKETVFYDKPLTLSIICFDTELLGNIKNYLSEFFLLNNFGTRQSKGFGGFLLKGEKEDLSVFDKNEMPYFYFKLPANTNKEQTMNYALVVYNVMKSGINLTGYDKKNGIYKKPDAYLKGFSVREFLPHDTGSDKAFIKSNVLAGKARKYGSKEPSNKYDKYVFIRAILGLADNYDFKDDMRWGKVLIKNYDSLTISSNSISVNMDDVVNSKGINRFQSPATIKVFNDKVVFFFNNSYEIMQNQPFLLLKQDELSVLEEYAKRNKSLTAVDIKGIPGLAEVSCITTPSKFDVNSFIHDFVAYFNSNKGKLKNMPKPHKEASSLNLIE